MPATDRSQTDLEVLQSSHRGKFVTLGVLIAAAGGVWWFMNRSGPIGNDEDPSRVLVVTQSHIRFKPYLEQWGFTAQEGRQQTMEDEAKEKMPEMTETGVAAVLKLADWAGYAYVAFENPGKVDFTGLTVEGGIPTFEPYHRFAVVSAGDYAFPHKLTVNAKPSEVMAGVDIDLLSALFAQEPLASVLREDPKNPPEVLVLRGTLEEGLHRLAAVKDAESTVAKISDKARALLVDKEQGDPKPAMLGAIHESLNGIGLADGGILVLGRRVHFSSTGYKAELELDRNWEFSYLAPGAAPGSERTPCTTLLGGSLEETGSRPIFRFSPGGDALLIHTDGASQVFRLEHGQGKPGCNFVATGKVGVPLARGEDPGQPHHSGMVARGRFDGDDSVVYVVKPGEQVPTELARSPSIRFDPPVWVSDDWLAAAGYVSGADTTNGAVYLMSPAHPDHALRLDAMALDASNAIHQIAPAPDGPHGPRLLVTASNDRGQRLFRVDAPKAWNDLFTDALAADKTAPPPSVVDGTEPRVLTLDGAGFTATALTNEGWVADMVAAPDGSAAVFQIRDIDNGVSDADSRHEIAAVSLDATNGQPALRLLTRNGLEDHTPMFTADSKTVVFRTRFPFEKTNWTLTTARSVPAHK